jgi:hypothetical protein
LGIWAASAGPTRVPSAGSWPAVRTVIHWPAALALAGSTKLPTKVAPAGSTTTSPGAAALSAAWRSPPAATLSVRPVGAGIAVLSVTRGSSATPAFAASGAALLTDGG